MKLILKIAAGVIIGLLTVQMLFMKFMDYENRKKGKELHYVQIKKHDKSIILMKGAGTYNKDFKTLPKLLVDLDCTAGGECGAGGKDSMFYISYQDEWLVVEPYLKSTNVEFNCKSTFSDYSYFGFQYC